MKKFLALCFAGCMLFAVGCGNGGEKGTDKTEEGLSTRVVGYLPDWSYDFYRELDFSALSHIDIAFCNPDGAGNLSCMIPDENLQDIVEKAHAAGTKVLAALGGGGGCDGYLPLLDTAPEMADFNQKIMAFCEKYSLDGLDLDIELDQSHKIWNFYADWVSSLRTLCDERGYELSTATAQWVAVKVTAETFAEFDFVSVMAYDDDVDKSSHASYDFAVEQMTWFCENKHISAEKLVLGVPFYGRGYTAAGKLDWNSYRSFSELVGEDPENYNRDVYEGVAYNGADTIRQKCDLAKEYGGIMIWEVTLDAPAEDSLLRVIKSEMTE